MSDRIEELRDAGVEVVRLQYPDTHGVNRGKDIPIGQFPHVADDGAAFCEAIMTVDLRHNVVSGFEHGFQDVQARPHMATLVTCPWDPTVAWVVCDLYRMATGKPFPGDPRAAVRAAVAAYEELGYAPVVGPELEFFLLRPDPDAPGGYTPYGTIHTPVYTVGDRADPDGVLRTMLGACVDAGLDAVAANHEYGRGQYEINVRHADALEAADRAFRLKSIVKDVAAQHGLTATFMGKPISDDEGSGFHIHVSLRGKDGKNAFADPQAEQGLAPIARHFTAGVIEHLPALAGLLLPTVNAYRRLTMHSLAPTHCNWGYDNRLTAIRIPHERGPATRVEVRAADGAANAYLAIAGLLFAGLDGIRRELEPPAPLAGLPYELPEEDWGPPLPGSLGESLAALEGDEVLCEGLGGRERDAVVPTYLEIKRYELERWNTHVEAVTPWELEEYAHHL